jgi:hypothetical protein
MKCILTIAIVGKERVRQHEAYWLEVYSHPEGGPVVLVNKVLFFVDARGKRRPKVEFVRGIAQLTGHPPMVLPNDWLQRWARGDFQAAIGYFQVPIDGVTYLSQVPYGKNNHYPIGPGCCGGYFYVLDMVNIDRFPPRIIDRGTEQVSVPAGGFTSQHWTYQRDRGDVWIAKGAGPFGVVKAGGPTVAHATEKMAEGSGPFAVPKSLYEERRRHPSAPVSSMTLVRVFNNAHDIIDQRPGRPDAPRLWLWLWEARKSLLPEMCLPDLGLPRFRN